MKLTLNKENWKEFAIELCKLNIERNGGDHNRMYPGMPLMIARNFFYVTEYRDNAKSRVGVSGPINYYFPGSRCKWSKCGKSLDVFIA